MKPARHLITALSVFIWIWAIASVAGIFFDPARAAFWSSSLMWALLATLLSAPALVMLYDESLVEEDSARSGSSPQRRRPAQTTNEKQKSESEGTGEGQSAASPSSEKRSFIDSAAAAYPVDGADKDADDEREETYPAS